MDNKFENPEYFYYQTISDIVITEVLGERENEKQSEEASSAASAAESQSEYVVEEPYDYIFEPDHYPSKNSNPKASTYMRSRLIEEKDGILVYEHNKKPNIDAEIEKELDNFYALNHHLNALIRSINLPKWPRIGFGFDLALDKHDLLDEHFYYVKNIHPDSPAEFGLQLGDVLLEVDEMNPLERFVNLKELNEYLSKRENCHLMAIHHSKLVKLKSENEEVKQYCSNCKDIVIVSLNEQLNESTR